MMPIGEFAARFRAELDALDALTEEVEGEAREALEELNAELEDALFMLDELDPAEEGWREELADTLEELQSLAEDYQNLKNRPESVDESAMRLHMAVQMARENLGE